MSSWIGVYGHNRRELDWMKKNHQKVDERFRRIHPVYEDGDERFEHGIIDEGNSSSQDLRFSYYWSIPCHWDSGEHFKQTESDVRAVLKKLHAPKILEVYLSPHAS